MGTPYMGEIKIISWNFAPQGWAFANGQLLPINQNQALFSLFGTMYGGDGRVNFALPDLRGRVPIHVGPQFSFQGGAGGETAHTIAQSEMPTHVHTALASSSVGTQPVPVGALYGVAAEQPYQAPDNNVAPLNAATIQNVGGSQAHENRQPYLVLNFIVALQGVFPSRN
jgi:microcystin-dependent protein